MNEDVMVIPLRVPRETGRAWKLEAVKQDKSVQRWILDRLERHQTSSGDDTPRDGNLGVKAVRSSRASSTLADGPKVAPTPVSESAKHTPEEVEAKQRSCKHAFLPGSRQCVRCGWVPPIMG